MILSTMEYGYYLLIIQLRSLYKLQVKDRLLIVTGSEECRNKETLGYYNIGDSWNPDPCTMCECLEESKETVNCTFLIARFWSSPEKKHNCKLNLLL